MVSWTSGPAAAAVFSGVVVEAAGASLAAVVTAFSGVFVTAAAVSSGGCATTAAAVSSGVFVGSDIVISAPCDGVGWGKDRYSTRNEGNRQPKLGKMLVGRRMLPQLALAPKVVPVAAWVKPEGGKEAVGMLEADADWLVFRALSGPPHIESKQSTDHATIALLLHRGLLSIR